MLVVSIFSFVILKFWNRESSSVSEARCALADYLFSAANDKLRNIRVANIIC